MSIINTIESGISAGIQSVLYAKTKQSAMLRSVAVAAVSVGLVTLAGTGIAEAGGTDFNSYATQVSNKTNVAADIVTYVSYIAGAGLTAIGIVDLKKHVENPSQTPLKNGLAKLGVGGMLIALPFLANVATSTFGGNDQAQYQNFGQRPQL